MSQMIGASQDEAKSPGLLFAKLDFEPQFWAIVSALRGFMDAVKHRHVVLGYIYLKYTLDASKEHQKRIFAELWADSKDPNKHRADNAFRVPLEVHWSGLSKRPSAHCRETDITGDDCTVMRDLTSIIREV